RKPRNAHQPGRPTETPSQLMARGPAVHRLAPRALGWQGRPMKVRVEHEPGRFVVRLDGAEATLVYERRGDLLDLQHTFTPPALRGSEIAARLTEAAFAYARSEEHTSELQSPDQL